MGKSTGWGILGSGRMATSFAEAMQSVADARIIAVGSRSQESATAFASRYDIPHALDSYAALAAHPEVEVVYIATPHVLHRDNMLMCLEAGKAVLCEKPFTINAAEAETVIRLAREKKLFLMEAMWTRYVPAVTRLRELLEQGVIGEVQLMLAGGAFMPSYDADFYLFNPELGGGVLLDAGVYLVSMASMLFGRPRAVRALAGMGDTGIDEHDAWLLEYGSGAIASHYVSLRGQSSPDLTLLGSLGRIYLHPPVFCPAKLTLELYDGEKQVLELPPAGNGYQYEIMEVNQCLAEGQTESPLMPLHESLDIMATMDEIRRQIGLKYPCE